MESVIKWQTGVPTEAGWYIVTKPNGIIRVCGFSPTVSYDIVIFKKFVIAWCKLSDIEPYKEEKK